MKYVGRKARKGSLFMYQNNIYNWRATVTGVPELLRPVDKQLLGL